MDRRTLKLKRVELDLSQHELARRLAVTQNTISRWESGAAGIRHPRILELALERLQDEEQTDKFGPVVVAGGFD